MEGVVHHRKGFHYHEQTDDNEEHDCDEEQKKVIDEAEEDKKYDYDHDKKEKGDDDFLEHIADSLFKAFVIAAIIKSIQFIYHRFFDSTTSA